MSEVNSRYCCSLARFQRGLELFLKTRQTFIPRGSVEGETDVDVAELVEPCFICPSDDEGGRDGSAFDDQDIESSRMTRRLEE